MQIVKELVYLNYIKILLLCLLFIEKNIILKYPAIFIQYFGFIYKYYYKNLNINILFINQINNLTS